MSDIEEIWHIYKLVKENEIDGCERIQEILFVFDRLPRRMKLIMDYKVQGLSAKEIAEILKIEKKTVLNVIYTARKRFIRACL